MDAARLEPLPALALTVSARNPTAISPSRRVGFTEAGNADGILVMALLLDEEGSTAYQLEFFASGLSNVGNGDGSVRTAC